jgi:Holliday junction DNA helicase RuvA
MIEFVEGEVVSRHPGQVILAVGGVGFLVFVPLSTYDRLPGTGPLRLLTHMVPREDRFLLFGFLTVQERELFNLLLTVKGVGPRLALKILSGLQPTDLVQALMDGEVGQLCRVSGVGKKTAQRLVVELRDAVAHLSAAGATHVDSAAADAVMALIKLGAYRTDAEKAVEKARKGLESDAGAEEIVRECLRKGFV